jgi:phosphoribosylglycinamide formyltransferase-1
LTPDSRTARRIGYLASGEGNLIETCAQAVDHGVFPGLENACLVADRDCGALHRPALDSMPRVLVDFERFADRRAFDEELHRVLSEHGADVLFLTFNRLLSDAVVDAYEGMALNMHLSLLPAFPGFGAIEGAIEAGVRFAGSTIHIVDKGVDTGPIVVQGVVAVAPSDTAASLADKLYPLQQRMALYSVLAVSQGRLEIRDGRGWIADADYSAWPINPVPRDESLARYVDERLG